MPIAVGAMIGPTAGAILGGVFGLVSMKDAITGVSAMTSVFFQISPINTFVLCVVMRVLMGWCVACCSACAAWTARRAGAISSVRCPRRC
ncbi:MAG: hypothetical protein ACLRVN_00740 [Butyricicoccus sp.]